MGASQWSYFTDWQPSPAAALEKLRDEVFAKGDFGEMVQWERSVQVFESLPSMKKRTVFALKALVKVRRAYDHFRRGKRPNTIQQAIDHAAEEGTHSILDITAGISEKPAFAAAFPAPESWLLQAYATTHPTRAQVEEGFPPAENLERWSATFFPVSESPNGPPRWWYFEGCSGD